MLIVNIISLHIAIELRSPVATRKSDLLEVQIGKSKPKVSRVKEVPTELRVKPFDKKGCYDQEEIAYKKLGH